MRARRGTARAGALVATALLTGACFQHSSAPSPTANPGSGGNLTLLEQVAFPHLDPARNYVTEAMSFSRLLYRTLTTYRAVPGPDGRLLAPDLATDTGSASHGGKVWTFHLKSGLKYEDGSPITAADVKYGVERTFAGSLTGGPSYARQLLVGGDTYPGPYDDPSPDGLASIETPDSSTIVFHLKAAHGDFNYVTQLPLFSPVPAAHDTRDSYDAHPFSSGPYRIRSYRVGREIRLERNPYWSPATDSVRTALPESVRVVFGLDGETIDKRIVADKGADAAALQFGSRIQLESEEIVNNRRYAARTAVGFANGLTYLALNTSHRPYDSLAVRQAVTLCTDKGAIQAARGGPLLGGAITQQVLIPAVVGYRPYDPLGLGPKPEGDVARAKALLASAGVAQPLTMTVQAPQTSRGTAEAKALQTSLARCGIKVTVTQLPLADYYTVIGRPADEADAVFAEWGADWATASTLIPPLFDSRQIATMRNVVFSNYSGPKAALLDSRMDAAAATVDSRDAAAKWSEIDRTITDLALVVPLVVPKGEFIWGSKVYNAYVHAYYGTIDVVTLGVRS